MTKKHYLLFEIWKIKMYFKGVRKNAPVEVWSTEKRKYIKGYVQYLFGDSMTKEKYCFAFFVRFLEPIKGFDSRFFASGTYSEKDIKTKKINIKL